MCSEGSIYPSLGAWRGMSASAAIAASRKASEPALGLLQIGHAQICPQNPGRIDVDDAEWLRLQHQDIRLRLHANAHVMGWSSRADAATFDEYEAYFRNILVVSQALAAPAYTWHAGSRRNADLYTVLERTERFEDMMGIPVGIEGMYPTPDDHHLLSSWGEYQMLLDSGVRYALDLSHIHILATQSDVRNETLVQELLANEACIEVHISGNDGDRDSHQQLATRPWWWSCLIKANPAATIFSEGGQTRPTYY